MSSTQSRRAAALVGTDRLVGPYATSHGAGSDVYADLAAVVLFSVTGLAVSLLVAASASVPTMDVIVAALMS